jgi:hypothetical protein
MRRYYAHPRGYRYSHMWISEHVNKFNHVLWNFTHIHKHGYVKKYYVQAHMYAVH